MIKGITLTGSTTLNPFSSLNWVEKFKMSSDGTLASVIRDTDEIVGGLVWYFRGNDWARVANYHPGSLEVGEPMVANLHRWIRAHHVPEVKEKFVFLIANDEEDNDEGALKRLLYKKVVVRSVMARVGDPSKFIASVAASHWRDE